MNSEPAIANSVGYKKSPSTVYWRSSSVRPPPSVFLAVSRYLLSGAFWFELINPKSSFSLGTYRRHNGDRLTTFFTIENVPLSSLRVQGEPLKNSLQYHRVKDLLEKEEPNPADAIHRGRDLDRTRALISARHNGTDDFVVCIVRIKKGFYNIVDGRTRAALTKLTGSSSIRAVVTPWG